MPRVTDFNDYTNSMLGAAAQIRSANQAADQTFLQGMLQTAQLTQGMQSMVMADSTRRAELGEATRQFDETMLARANEFAASLGLDKEKLNLDWAKLRESADQFTRSLQFSKEIHEEDKRQFGLTHDLKRDQYNHDVTSFAANNLIAQGNLAQLTRQVDEMEAAGKFGRDATTRAEAGEFINQLENSLTELNAAAATVMRIHADHEMHGRMIGGTDRKDYLDAKQVLNNFAASGMQSMAMRAAVLGMEPEQMENILGSFSLYADKDFTKRYEVPMAGDSPLLDRKYSATVDHSTQFSRLDNMYGFGMLHNNYMIASNLAQAIGWSQNVQNEAGQNVSITNQLSRFLDNKITEAESGNRVITRQDRQKYASYWDSFINRGLSLWKSDVDERHRQLEPFMNQFMEKMFNAEYQSMITDAKKTDPNVENDPIRLSTFQRIAQERATPPQIARGQDNYQYFQNIEQALRNLSDITFSDAMSTMEKMEFLAQRGVTSVEIENKLNEFKKNQAFLLSPQDRQDAILLGERLLRSIGQIVN